MTAPPARTSRRFIAPRASLRTTLVLLLTGMVALVCLAVGIVTHVSVERQLSAQLDAQLARASDRAAQTITPDADDPRPPTRGHADPDGPGGGEFELGARVGGGAVTSGGWREGDGNVRSLTSADRARLLAAAQETDRHHGRSRGTDVELSIGEYRIVALHEPDGDTIITGMPLREMHATRTRLDLTLLVAGTAAVLLTGIAGSLIARRTMRPLETVARIASDVAVMPLDTGTVTLSERIPAQSARPGTEVGEVSRALNRLLDNVEGALVARQRTEERMRRFIADASHELRTPLTSIRGYTELLRLTDDLSERGRQSLDRLDAQSQRMTSLVEDLLLLARLDDGDSRADDELDLGEIVVETVLDARVMGADHVWSLDVPDGPVLVRGDARQLTQVLVNLLSNARKHTPPGTRVAVRLRADGAEAVVTVTDDGPGIDGSLGDDVFDRFARADRARSGTEGTAGLGLSIVRAIVQGHGGRIDVDSRAGRTVFTVRIPLA